MAQENLWQSPNRIKAAIALLLTFVAGYVDVVGFLALYQVFAANMTGNTVHFANDIVRANWSQALLPGVTIALFVGGSIFGRSVIEIGARNHLRRIASIALLMEAVLIGFASLAPHKPASGITTAALCALAAAMGLQTAILTRVGPLTVHTTFVTGMLNKLAQLASHYLFVAYDSLRGERRAIEARTNTRNQALFIFSIWLLYFSGAAAGAALESAFGLRTLVVPVILLGVAILVDQASPLSLREEQEQLEPGP